MITTKQVEPLKKDQSGGRSSGAGTKAGLTSLLGQRNKQMPSQQQQRPERPGAGSGRPAPPQQKPQGPPPGPDMSIPPGGTPKGHKYSEDTKTMAQESLTTAMEMTYSKGGPERILENFDPAQPVQSITKSAVQITSAADEITSAKLGNKQPVQITWNVLNKITAEVANVLKAKGKATPTQGMLKEALHAGMSFLTGNALKSGELAPDKAAAYVKKYQESQGQPEPKPQQPGGPPQAAPQAPPQMPQPSPQGQPAVAPPQSLIGGA